MERKDLEAAAAHVTYLRGLLAIPLGGLFIINGLGNLGWDPLGHPWIFFASLLVLGAAWQGTNRYYNDHYGRVTRSRHQQARYAVASLLLFPAAMVGGSVVDSSIALPVSVSAAAFALAMLAWLAIGVATIAAGIFDHRALVRTYGPAKDPNLEHGNVGA